MQIPWKAHSPKLARTVFYYREKSLFSGNVYLKHSVKVNFSETCSWQKKFSDEKNLKTLRNNRLRSSDISDPWRIDPKEIKMAPFVAPAKKSPTRSPVVKKEMKWHSSIFTAHKIEASIITMKGHVWANLASLHCIDLIISRKSNKVFDTLLTLRNTQK